jgi:peptidyl-prolyl cis-trans isomerase A (cyclophilin A)
MPLPKPSLSRARRRRPCEVTPLEPRVLMSTVSLASQETVEQTIPNVLAASGATAQAAQTVTLSNYIEDPNVPGTIATFETSKGNIVVALTDQATPVSVANFLSYVTSGAYDDTIFHRSAFFDANDTTGLGVGGSAADPANIIQGGGYALENGTLTHIATSTPIENFETSLDANSGVDNVQDTIAFANTGAADSASSEWFFNNLDNSGSFDGSYTAFGHVISGADVVNTISSLPTNYSSGGTEDITAEDNGTSTSLNQVPLSGLTATQIAGGAPVGASNLVYVDGITTEAGTTYTATSNDPGLVGVSISNGVLSFKYGTAGTTGTATITVTATSVYDQTTATTSFAVTVPPTSSTATAPITTATTVPAAVTGQATVIAPLLTDTDATSALNPATVTITTAPADGTATVDPVSGNISYTPNGGYTGADTLEYTVADDSGAVSAPTAVNISVVPVPLAVTIGTGSKVKSILYTQPDGAKARLSLSYASAVVTFSPGDVTTSVSDGTETITGAGATISDVVVTNTINAAAAPNVTLAKVGAGGGTVTLGGMSDFTVMNALNLSTVTVTGTVSIGGLNTLRLGGATDATLNLGAAAVGTIVDLGTAVDTSMTVGVLRSLVSKQWTNDDGGAYLLDAVAIQSMRVTGTFGDELEVTSGSGYAITSATVGNATAGWYVDGGIFKATVLASTSGWSVDDGSLIQTLAVRGTFTGVVEAAAIDNMTVSGAMSNATVETTGLFNQKAVQLQHLTVAGAMTDSVVFGAGNVGAVSALSMSGSKVYAGVLSSVAQASGLPSATTDLSAEATLGSVSLRAPKATFADSEIAAYKIGSVHLGTITAGNGGTSFGVSGHSVGSVVGVLDPGGRLALSSAQLKSATALSTYLTKKKISLSDFVVTLY